MVKVTGPWMRCCWWLRSTLHLRSLTSMMSCWKREAVAIKECRTYKVGSEGVALANRGPKKAHSFSIRTPDGKIPFTTDGFESGR